MAETLTRFDPFAKLDELRTRSDRVTGPRLDGHERVWRPGIDVVRNDGHLIVRADLPGIKPAAIKIEVEDDILTISGEHEERTEEKDEEYLRRERRYGSLSRSMALPKGVDAKKIRASTHDGVVEVTVPLPTESSQEPVRIIPTVVS